MFIVYATYLDERIRRTMSQMVISTYRSKSVSETIERSKTTKKQHDDRKNSCRLALMLPDLTAHCGHKTENSVIRKRHLLIPKMGIY